MASGIEVFNTTGSLQITDSYKNLQYLGKVDITVPSDQVFVESYVGADEVIAFRTSATYIYTMAPYEYNSSNIMLIFAPSNSVITLYKFSYQDIPPGNYFEVRNSDGEIVFSDAGTWMKVLDGKRGVQPQYSTEGQTIATTLHEDTVTTAIVPGLLAATLNTGSASGKYATQMFRFESSYVISMYKIAPLITWTTSSVIHTYYNYLVIDVTGL